MVPLHGWLTLAGLEAGMCGNLDYQKYCESGCWIMNGLVLCQCIPCIHVMSNGYLIWHSFTQTSLMKWLLAYIRGNTSNSRAVFHTVAMGLGREWSLHTHGKSSMPFMMGLC
jgi:hypothetical protein